MGGTVIVPDQNINQDQTSSGESLKGNSLDVKIGYDKRAAAKRDLAVVLQDVEGSQLTDALVMNLSVR